MTLPTRSLPALALSLAAVASAQATVQIEVSGAYLRGSASAKVPYGSGTLLLVASTSDAVFDAITPSSNLTLGGNITTGGDDLIIGKTNISGDGRINGVPDDGEFRFSLNVTLNTSLTSGDPLILYWLPNIASSSTTAAGGTAYGAYRSPVANTAGATDADGSSAWFVPTDGTSGYSLIFRTSDTGSAVNTGTSGTPFGQTTLTVVPEPGTALLAGAGALALGLRRRRRG